MLLRSLLVDRIEQAWSTGEISEKRCPRTQKLLGHDDETLHRYLRSDTVIATTPHASANIFFPRADTSVQAARMARDNDGFQVRAVLTHTTLSDLRWRPYAWWVISEKSELSKITFESRNKARKHVAVHACGPTDPQQGLQLVPEIYREAWLLAGSARCLSWSLMLLAAKQERLSGTADAGHTLYVPLQWISELAGAWLLRDGGAGPGTGDLLRARGRRLDLATGQLVAVCSGEESFVYDNATNLTMLGLFTHLLVGSEKMAGYWPTLSTDAAPGIADTIEAPVFHMKSPETLADAYPPPPLLAEQLTAAGICYSLGMARSLFGSPLV